MSDERLPSPASAVDPPHALATHGWNRTVSQALASLGDGVPARVIRADRAGCLVVTERGVERCHVPRGLAREPGADWPPTTGDWVLVRAEPGLGFVLAAVAERYSALHRNDPSDSRRQVLAANLDTVLVLRGLDRPDKLGRLERFLVMVWDGGAIPVIVLTKTDLFPADEVARRLAAVAAVAGGADIIAISSATGSGVDALSRYLLPGATVAVVGESGAGKSTLANRLASAEVMATNPTRSDGKGRHTTTQRELVPLPGGAVLIDTPGLRAVGLWEGDRGVGHVFGDVEDLARRCRFSDCSHTSEPGCAVLAALASGDLDERRMDSYRKLQKELAYVELRNDVRIRRAAGREAGRRYRAASKERRGRRRSL